MKRISIFSEQVREFYAMNLVQGELGQDGIDEMVALYEHTSLWKRMGVLVVQVDTLQGLQFDEKDIDLVKFAINNIANKLIMQQKRLKPTISHNNTIIIIGDDSSSDEGFKPYLQAQASLLCNTIGEVLGITVSIGISRTFYRFSDTAAAYLESIEALKYKICAEDELIIHIDDMNPEYKSMFTLPKDIENNLIAAIKFMDEDGAKKCLHDFMDKILKEQVTHREFQVFMVWLIIDLFRMMQERGESFKSIQDDRSSLIEQLMALRSAKEIENWFMKSIIEPIMQVMDISNKNQHHQLSEDVVRIVHERYDTDLTLEVCASLLSYHPNYIGRVFRKEMKINFSQYLSEYRLEVAKKWLRDSDMRIFNIAEKLRYSNSQNFTRFFRRVVGMTPVHYREKKKK